MEKRKDPLIKDGPGAKDYLSGCLTAVTIFAALITIASFFDSHPFPFASAAVTPAVTPVAVPVAPPQPVVSPAQPQAFQQACVLESTDYDAMVSGYLATVTVRQRFVNPNHEKMDAVYSFPLSDRAAIDDVTMQIGDRKITSKIEERSQAQAEYQAARQSGYSASLVEQVRTNIFRQSVANIEPGKAIEVTLKYTEELPFSQGQYSLVFPTKIGPRFIPDGCSGDTSAIQAANSSEPAPVHVCVSLNEGGIPITKIDSPTERMNVNKMDWSHALINFQNSHVEKDIVINWQVLASEMQSGFLAHRTDKTGFLTAMIMPPKVVSEKQAAPKEMIFIVDCSGSQAGAPLQKAQETLNYIVDHMHQNDTFQIIAFNCNLQKNSKKPVPATQSTKAEAHRFIDGLNADGGTVMLPAIEQACALPSEKNRIRIVTIMTDGFIGNDYEVLDVVKRMRGTSRWFPFGTGNNVNRTLIDGIAREGGGEPEVVLLDSPGEKVAKHFYDRINNPVLTDVSVSFEGVKMSHVYPHKPSDVWENRPLYIQACYDTPGSGAMIIKGFSQGKPYVQKIPVVLPDRETNNKSVAQIWARARIDELMSQDWKGMQSGNTSPEIKQDIINTSLQYHVLSQFTAFVAVDSAKFRAEANVSPAETNSENTQQNSQQVSARPAANTAVNAASAPSSFAACAPGTCLQSVSNYSGSQSMQGDSAFGPMLQGATNGTIGPQGSDAIVINGINTAGCVRVNNLANLEALLNVIANGIEVLGIAFGLPLLIGGFMGKKIGRFSTLQTVLLGTSSITCGLATPGLINWLVATARDINIIG